VFEQCDQDSCTLLRPDGGILLGDLDGVEFAFRSPGTLDDEERFVGEAGAEDVPVPDEEPDPCAGTAARRWDVRIELSVQDRVLSGTALRRPESQRVEAAGVTCFGLDLTLGFSGVPAAAGASAGSG
jgi:hypothetical protein